MKFALDYDKLIFLDAEGLAEGGIAEAYATVLPHLKQYVSEPAEVREITDPSVPSYLVSCRGVDYPIYSPELPDDEGQDWGRAAHALFEIINSQLTDSEYRLFAINGGNELGGMFLTRIGIRERTQFATATRGLALRSHARSPLVWPAAQLASDCSASNPGVDSS